MEQEKIRIRNTYILPQLIIFFLFFSYLLWNFQFYNNVLGTLLILTSIFVSHYIVGALSRYDTVLSINDGYLVAESENVYGSFHSVKQIELTQIKAYEIHQNGLQRMVLQRLVLYRYDKPPLIFVLKRLSPAGLQEITSFLDKNNITPVKSLETLSGESFERAFVKSILILLSGVSAFLVFYALEIYILYKVSGRLPDMNILTIGFNFILIAIAIYIITRLLGKTYRIQADGTWMALGIMLPVTAIFIQSRLDIFSQSPLPVKEINKVKLYPYQRFFTVEDFSCDTTLTGYYLSISSGGSKSGVYTANHYFTSPVITSEDSQKDLKHEYWVSEFYNQKVSKFLSDNEKDRQRITFMNLKLHDFNRTFRKMPAFFEVVYSDLNPRARAEKYLYSVLSIGRIRRPLFILKPHPESFKAFVRSNEKQGVIVASVFSILLLLNAFIIARNR